jgi:hypothetical protein
VKRLISIAACAVSAACAAAAASSPPSTADRVIATTDVGILRADEHPSNLVTNLSASPAAAMAAASAAYNELGVEVKLYDPRSGVIGNRRFSLYHRFAGVPMSTYLGCGMTASGPGADNYRITMSLVTTILPSGSGSTVQTALEAKGEDPSSSQGLSSCLTTGLLEQRINALIATKAAQ